MKKMIELPPVEASRLTSVVQYPQLLINDKSRRQSTFADLKNKHARKIGTIILDLFRGKKVRKSRERETALGMIMWVFTNHISAPAHRKNPRGILTCTCGFTEHREILRKYGKLDGMFQN